MEIAGSNAGSDSCWRNECAGSGRLRNSVGPDLLHMLERIKNSPP